MLKQYLLDLLSKNQWKIICSVIGFVLAVAILLIGFFRTLLIALFVSVGYFIGKKIDNKEDFIEIIDKILPSGWNK